MCALTHTPHWYIHNMTAVHLLRSTTTLTRPLPPPHTHTPHTPPQPINLLTRILFLERHHIRIENRYVCWAREIGHSKMISAQEASGLQTKPTNLQGDIIKPNYVTLLSTIATTHNRIVHLQTYISMHTHTCMCSNNFSQPVALVCFVWYTTFILYVINCVKNILPIAYILSGADWIHQSNMPAGWIRAVCRGFPFGFPVRNDIARVLAILSKEQ